MRRPDVAESQRWRNEQRHGETIRAWTRARLPTPDLMQGKLLCAYLDSIQKGRVC